MPADPKIKQFKLASLQYTKLRHAIYQRAFGACEVCYRWTSFNEFDLHHKRSRGAGGSDTKENVIGVCRECHNKIHMGLVDTNLLL